ncbi:MULTISPECIES: hypothetical protein [Streptomyces]|uniref:Uncharacterized protein n=2 Tax=Streptomyces TaxID=1883 RepID=A0ABV9IF01_9ACTN
MSEGPARPVPGNRNHCKAWELSGTKHGRQDHGVLARVEYAIARMESWKIFRVSAPAIAGGHRNPV